MPIAERDMMSGLAKGLSVIECFSAERARLSISEAARLSGLDRATARRCLLTLVRHGYADWDGKFFTLTPRVLRLGTACLATMPLPQIVQPLLDRLSEEIGESTSVSVLDGGEIVYIARAAQKKVMSIALMPGSRLPAFCSSMGRVMLAALPEAAARTTLGPDPLPARTPHTETRPEAIMAELARVRDQGFALIDQEIELGLCSIAVPVNDSRGRVVAALNLGTAAGPWPVGDLARRFLPRLRQAQAELRTLLR